MSGIEILGAVAGAVALCTTALHLSKRVRRLAKRVLAIAKEIQDLANELSLFSGLLLEFGTLVKNFSSTWGSSPSGQRRLSLADELQKSARLSIGKLRGLVDKAEPLIGSSASTLRDKCVAHVKWWLDKDSILYMKSQLSVIKDYFQLFVGILLLHQAVERPEFIDTTFLDFDDHLDFRGELVRNAQSRVEEGYRKLQSMHRASNPNIITTQQLEDMGLFTDQIGEVARKARKIARATQSYPPSSLGTDLGSSEPRSPSPRSPIHEASDTRLPNASHLGSARSSAERIEINPRPENSRPTSPHSTNVSTESHASDGRSSWRFGLPGPPSRVPTILPVLQVPETPARNDVGSFSLNSPYSPSTILPRRPNDTQGQTPDASPRKLSIESFSKSPKSPLHDNQDSNVITDGDSSSAATKGRSSTYQSSGKRPSITDKAVSTIISLEKLRKSPESRNSRHFASDEKRSPEPTKPKLERSKTAGADSAKLADKFAAHGSRENRLSTHSLEEHPQRR